VKFQTDPKLEFKADEDCYFFDVLKVIELTGKFEFTYDQIRDLRKVSVRAEFMGKDGYLNAKGISGISSVASGLTKHHVYVKRVGSNDNYNHIIAKYARKLDSGYLFYHFVLANFDKPDELIDWDPWSFYGSKTGREGYVVEFRYLFSEAI